MACLLFVTACCPCLYVGEEEWGWKDVEHYSFLKKIVEKYCTCVFVWGNLGRGIGTVWYFSPLLPPRDRAIVVVIDTICVCGPCLEISCMGKR
ncbi:MAG: hypothetical protein J3R72DRAFT_431260 [Linnemannia gamsii]|nr:MAG: hypothetical protein J3R72DRAFT_431260 [Linnemannia gamsii]